MPLAFYPYFSCQCRNFSNCNFYSISSISTNAPRVPTTLGYFPKESKAPITPDLSNEERKKLGLVYYKPLSDELKALLEVKPNIEPR